MYTAIFPFLHAIHIKTCFKNFKGSKSQNNSVPQSRNSGFAFAWKHIQTMGFRLKWDWRTALKTLFLPEACFIVKKTLPNKQMRNSPTECFNLKGEQ